MNRNSIGVPGLVAAMAIAVVMMIVSRFCLPHLISVNDFGICLPSPNLWGLAGTAGWIANIIMLIGATPLLVTINKKYNFVKGNGMTFPIIFILLAASNAFISNGFGTSTLLLYANILCLPVLFDTIRSKNSTQEYFLIATVLSLGSMVQYAFLPMAIAYLACGLVMRSLAFRELIAFLLGIIAPYWVAVGLGLVPLSSFRTPGLANIFYELPSKADIFIVLLSTGIFFLAAALICMNNAMILFAGNSGVRRMNNCINIIGFSSALCMMADFNNLFAYSASLYLWIGVQAGNLFALHKLPKPRIALAIISAGIIALYIWELTAGFSFPKL